MMFACRWLEGNLHVVFDGQKKNKKCFVWEEGANSSCLTDQSENLPARLGVLHSHEWAGPVVDRRVY